MSKAAQEVCKALMEKNRHKRPGLETVLNMEWFSEYKAINKVRADASAGEKFQAYTLTTPDSPKIKQEIDGVLAD